MKYTKASIKGKEFKALRVVKRASIEDIPTMRKWLEKEVSKQGLSMKETETAFELSSGQFFLKPKLPKETLGILKCGPTFATFEGVRIEYVDMTLDSDYALIETKHTKYAIHKELNRS